MKKTFSTREKIMLGILIVLLVGLLYFNFILTPINDRVSALKSQIADEQTMIDTSMPQMMRLNRMKAELEVLKSDSEAKAIPEYDNVQKVMDELHLILSSAGSYTLNFNGTSVSESIVRRPIGMTFTAANYAQARDIIDRLDASAYTSQISDLSVTNKPDGEGTEVNLNITFYELAVSYSK